jgi:hypothetical protein
MTSLTIPMTRTDEADRLVSIFIHQGAGRRKGHILTWLAESPSNFGTKCAPGEIGADQRLNV